MEKAKINRINELYRKSKTTSLTEAERAEQLQLREEYRASMKKNLIGQLKNTKVVDEKGNVIRDLSKVNVQ